MATTTRKRTSGAEDGERKRKIILIAVAATAIVVAIAMLILQRPEVAETTDQAAVEAADAVIERLKDQPAPPAPTYTDDTPGNVARPAGG